MKHNRLTYATALLSLFLATAAFAGGKSQEQGDQDHHHITYQGTLHCNGMGKMGGDFSMGLMHFGKSSEHLPSCFQAGVKVHGYRTESDTNLTSGCDEFNYQIIKFNERTHSERLVIALKSADNDKGGKQQQQGEEEFTPNGTATLTFQSLEKECREEKGERKGKGQGQGQQQQCEHEWVWETTGVLECTWEACPI